MARRRLTAALAGIAVLLATVVVAGAVFNARDGDGAAGPRGGASTTTGSDSGPGPGPPADGGDHPAVDDPMPSGPRGGTVRVAVWGAPDPSHPTLGGAAVRALVLPQLFYAKPDGRWGPLLVEPGSDRAAADLRSATFRLRAGAAWSDGSTVGVEDLRRSSDPRFVEAVDGPAGDGTVTVRFTQALPGWRRLWSGVDSIAPPKDGLWGGPFQVVSMAQGLETVLGRNPGWKGPGPLLDELRLVLVPDATTARQLLEDGVVDVVAPPASTQRSDLLGGLGGVGLHSTVADGGWWVGLFFNPAKLGAEERKAITATVDRRRFTSVLLDGEAVRLDGFGGVQDAAWSAAGWGASSSAAADVRGLAGDTVDFVGQIEEPMTELLHRSMQKRARQVGGRLELRTAEADRVEPWLREGNYQAAVVMTYDGPSICWRCRWADVDLALVQAADAGDLNAVAALEAKLAGESLVVPLWRPRPAVAWRTSAVAPLRANPYGLSAAWDAWRWHKP